jgi:hypothetical protein
MATTAQHRKIISENATAKNRAPAWRGAIHQHHRCVGARAVRLRVLPHVRRRGRAPFPKSGPKFESEDAIEGPRW